ncbi:MAG: flagellar motor switch protein FliM [Planctomycetes bacterium]|nr:flagellar motor switch protein FliM [Planctomycetota bacterium]
MSNDVLNQNEVESLLSAMESKAAEASTRADALVSTNPSRTREKITPYDFKRPERVGKEQMRALQSLHEGFGRTFGAAISALLRTIVEVKLTSVDQLTYSEFIFSLDNPTCLNLLTAQPLEGNLILDINPSILYPIINRLLGGGADFGSVARRPLTEIELRLVGRITDLFLKALKRAWSNILSLDFGVERVESNPQLVQIVPPNEVVVLISFELTLGDVRGMMNLCIPFNAIERIANRLSTNNWVAYTSASPTNESIKRVSSRLHGATVELVATLARSRITTSDLLELRVGDIITTEHDVHAPMDVAVEGIVKFHASPGALKGQKALQIEGPVTNMDGRDPHGP